MVYKIIDRNGNVANIIEADEDFAKTLAEEIGGTYEEEHRSEPTPERSHQDDVDEMIVDHEYRLTLIELGV